jgi:hypothetical protein
MLRLVQTYLKQNPIELLYYVDIDHDRLMLEQIENINNEKNLDNVVLYHLFLILKI